MMLVLRGQVRISILSEEGKELVFNLIQPGECFGEIALLDGQPRSAAATLVGQCVLFAPGSLRPFLLCHPRAAKVCSRCCASDCEPPACLSRRLVFQSLPARLARLLLNLAEIHGVSTPTGIPHCPPDLTTGNRQPDRRQPRECRASNCKSGARKIC